MIHKRLWASRASHALRLQIAMGFMWGYAVVTNGYTGTLAQHQKIIWMRMMRNDKNMETV